jgi:hypothetical protein
LPHQRFSVFHHRHALSGFDHVALLGPYQAPLICEPDGAGKNGLIRTRTDERLKDSMNELREENKVGGPDRTRAQRVSGHLIALSGF